MPPSQGRGGVNQQDERLTRIRCQIILGQNDAQYFLEVTQIFIKIECFKKLSQK